MAPVAELQKAKGKKSAPSDTLNSQGPRHNEEWIKAAEDWEKEKTKAKVGMTANAVLSAESSGVRGRSSRRRGQSWRRRGRSGVSHSAHQDAQRQHVREGARFDDADSMRRQAQGTREEGGPRGPPQAQGLGTTGTASEGEYGGSRGPRRGR